MFFHGAETEREPRRRGRCDGFQGSWWNEPENKVSNSTFFYLASGEETKGGMLDKDERARRRRRRRRRRPE